MKASNASASKLGQLASQPSSPAPELETVSGAVQADSVILALFVESGEMIRPFGSPRSAYQSRNAATSASETSGP